eukprot:274904-Amphidinium_carterae.1
MAAWLVPVRDLPPVASSKICDVPQQGLPHKVHRKKEVVKNKVAKEDASIRQHHGQRMVLRGLFLQCRDCAYAVRILHLALEEVLFSRNGGQQMANLVQTSHGIKRKLLPELDRSGSDFLE